MPPPNPAAKLRGADFRPGQGQPESGPACCKERGSAGIFAPSPEESAMSVLAAPRKPSATPQTGRDARLAARAGAFKGQTAGVAPGYVQGNLAILPANLAGDFLRFCQLNPKPCPL